MQRSSATVVTLVGPDAARSLPGLAAAGRVRTVTVDAELGPLERAAAAQRLVSGSGSTLAVSDIDPLAGVVDAWTGLYAGTGVAGALEVAVAATVAIWRAGTVELPDYFVVLDPDAWEPTRRHWYLGVLTAAAPSRVLPVPSADAVPGVLRRLPSGRWWPTLERLLDGIDHQLPDRLPTGEDAVGPRLLPARR